MLAQMLTGDAVTGRTGARGMVQALRLDLKQSQQLVMTPQLQQAIKLLQMSNLELRGFVEQELEKNPLIRLDEAGGGAAPDAAPEPARDLAEAPLDARVTPEGDPGLAAETFDTGTENLHDADPAPSRAGTGPGGGSGGGSDTPGFDWNEQPEGPPGLRAHLLAQLGLMRAEAPVAALARLIVDELDEHGYLRAGLDELAARLGASAGQAEAALALVQGCEPTGVGARGLAECLALQLTERDRLDPAMRRLLGHLDLLARGERKRLMALCGVDAGDLADMLAEIRALDPRPCAAFGAGRAETLVPDLLLRPDRWGGWEIELNPDTLPRVLIDQRYAARLGRAGADARGFVAECRASGNWLIRSLDQRARTILKVAAEIVRHQDAFFRDGIGGLKPLTLAMVAEATGLHESTASRVTANKYIATGRGIFELKFFFTNAVGGAEGMSAETARQRIRALVAAEPPGRVLSDDAIVERLQKDGVDIARRTVAKYRKQLGIGSSAERRRARALMP
jgi:RNA polymerase sigma-54 factor